ncbi:MAG TPA: methylmalonyl-CoA mutase family protein [Saprospiraceae bacterium]|nr:methylmalonyl-CoA mutase family protein [Saprospiraceae bacterium]
MSEKLFSEFPYTTSKQWLAQITKDLKGRSPAEMQWSPDGDLVVHPYVHGDDVPEAMPEVPSFGKWQIGESFIVIDEKESNRQILEALRGGAESLHTSCTDTVKWEQLFADVELPFIHIGLHIKGDADQSLHDLMLFADNRWKFDELRITLYFRTAVGYPNVRFSSLPIVTERVVDGVASTLFDALDSASWDRDQLKQRDLAVSMSMHYLIEIARLRALRILWTNLVSALQFPISPVFAIEAHTKECSSQDDPYTHMIRSTVMGVAAVLGGADRVYIHPSVGMNHTESFYRHIARNIHHLLRYESKFSEISDPVSGAYYIDKLTREIVDRVWERLLQRMKESGR